MSGVFGRLFALATHAGAWQGSDGPQSASVEQRSPLFFGAGSLQADAPVCEGAGVVEAVGPGFGAGGLESGGSDEGGGSGGDGAAALQATRGRLKAKAASFRRPFGEQSHMALSIGAGASGWQDENPQPLTRVVGLTPALGMPRTHPLSLGPSPSYLPKTMLTGDAPLLLGRTLTLSDLEQVARKRRPVALCPESRARVDASRHAIDAIAAAGDGAPAVYGVNTGFGALVETRIREGDIRALQKNLVRSHACGVGPALGEAEVRAMMVLRAQVIALGFSGVRAEVIDALLAMLNRGVYPRIPAQGSVGASGDLAPLAHLALALIGEGEATFEGRLMPAAEALAAAGLRPIELAAKEGLSLINGTQYMSALGALALRDAARLATLADVVGAVSLEAHMGSQRPFEERLMRVRPHPGQAASADNLRVLLRGSKIMESHVDCHKVQDAYSLRCMPQVHGATRDALAWASEVLGREINSVTDNPTVFLSEGGGADLISGGNFHGQPVALALDLAAIAAAELASISERRVEQLVNPALSSGLSPFLAPKSGLHSGFMIAQVASASLVSENKVLCHPASVDSIPSSAGREDHVSMGSISARKLAQVIENVRVSIAIELLTAAQGIDQRRPLLPSAGVRAAHAAVRAVVPELTEDRPLYKDIEAVGRILADDSLIRAVEEVTGPLK
jgi:histidine ammonia-lyase